MARIPAAPPPPRARGCDDTCRRLREARAASAPSQAGATLPRPAPAPLKLHRGPEAHSAVRAPQSDQVALRPPVTWILFWMLGAKLWHQTQEASWLLCDCRLACCLSRSTFFRTPTKATRVKDQRERIIFNSHTVFQFLNNLPQVKPLSALPAAEPASARSRADCDAAPPPARAALCPRPYDWLLLVLPHLRMLRHVAAAGQSEAGRPGVCSAFGGPGG